MGKKYIIELEDKPFTNTELSFEDEETLWRVKGFRSLVFDQNGLDKLTEYEATGETQSAYQKGLEDAWETARTIAGMSRDEMVECFGTLPLLRNAKADKMTPEEVLDKLKEFEKRQELGVGDEVVPKKGGWRGVVTRIDGNGNLTIIDANGAVADSYDKREFKRTGRRFPEMAGVLEAMRK